MDTVCKDITAQERQIMRQIAKKIARNINEELDA